MREPFQGGWNKCPVCGKEFFVTHQDLVYKRHNSKSQCIWFCSYGCMRKYDTSDPAMNGRGERKLKAPSKAERICEMLDNGLTMAEISRLTGYSSGTVNYYRDRYWDGASVREQKQIDSQGDDGSGACPDARG